MRVLLLMQWPAFLDAGQVYSEPVHTLDLMPTIYAAIGAQPSGEPLDGVNLLPYHEGQATESPHQYIFWRNGPGTRALRAGDWKLIRSVYGSVWLYNLAFDIGETQNLAAQYPCVAKFLNSILDDWSATLQSPAWPSRDSTIKLIDGQRVAQPGELLCENTPDGSVSFARLLAPASCVRRGVYGIQMIS